MSFDTLPFQFGPVFLSWLTTVGLWLLLLTIGVMAGSLIAMGFGGPVAVVRQVGWGIADWFSTSPSRVWALAVLTIRESVRKKVLLVFVVFAVLFLFAGWFITSSNADPRLQVKVHVSFVLKAISWLILPVLLLLSCWGLPDDIKARSLHTVVTKPVRRHEVVLGRILGFSLVGFFVLLIMGGVGYIWMNRVIPPQARSQLIARVPVYGKISFLTREGKPADSGINTGDVWAFRSYIEGATKARAIWEFQDESLRNPQDKLKIESNFTVFRIKKGIIDRGILAQLVAVNQKKGLRAPLLLYTNNDEVPSTTFEVKEFRDNIHLVPRKQTDDSGKEVDLYDDLMEDGTLRVEALCITGQQFLGMARPDLFIRMPDRAFLTSYAKGIMGIGVMIFMVVVLGVISSCFLKGPVATLLTFFVLLVGRIGRTFLDHMTTNETYHGGSIFESIYRILMHLNPDTDLANTPALRIMQGIDQLILSCLWATRYVFPDFSGFNMVEYVANGYDVPWRDSMVPFLWLMVGYVVPWILIGQYSLRLRELETR